MLKFMLVVTSMMIIKNYNAKVMMALTVLSFNLSIQTLNVQKISLVLMGDQISFWNSNLAIWIMMIILFMNTKKMKFHLKIMMFTLLTFMVMFFTWNFLMFYIMFEISMIIMLMVISSWSYQPERTEAIMFLIVMALIFSMPFMMMMMKNYKILNFWFFATSPSLWDYLSMLFIFMMKMPFYFTHFWLPKVHVEAPVQGSMILAAIMLKLGCYGLVRTMMNMKSFITANTMIMGLAMWGMVVLSMSCLIQSDMKTLIAYSSVVHMMMILMVILINKKKSLTSMMIITISHGLCASSLFFMSNMFYKNSKSRSMILNKSVSSMAPLITLLWFIMCMSNTPMPPAISMIGELISFKILMEWSGLKPAIFMISFTSSLYSIFMFYSMMHNKLTSLINWKFKTNVKAGLIIVMHSIPTIGLIIKPKMMMIT